MDQVEQPNLKEEKKRAKALQKQHGRDDRGIQTLFRTVTRNHFTSLEMIDRKANILLSVNSIIITLMIGNLVLRTPKAELTLQKMHSPIMIIFCVLSMVFAVIAIAPHQSPWSNKSVRKGILFHGSIVALPLEEYRRQVNDLLNNGTSLYMAITDDLFYLSKQIASKEESIRASLIVFILGISIAAVAYLCSNIFLKLHF